jgi:tetratricopeptide (TPR) repeat protein
MRYRKLRTLALGAAGVALAAQAAADGVAPRPLPIEAWCWQPAGEAEGGAGKEAQRPPVLVEGLGTSGIAPDTQNEEAHRWFDQGVRLIWAFDEVEAVRAFREAQRLDPNCALCFWGEAWARGPTINLRPRTEELADARAAAGRAVALSRRLPEREKRLIRAMRERTGATEFRNERYARTMERLAARYADDDAISVIAADARMVAADDLDEGSLPQQLLERVLARSPDHSGAIHMYIHLTDWIDRQDLAEHPAERLGRVAPAASHLVHMPSHTFYGIGRYEDAAAVNVRAIAADRAYVERVRPPASDYRTGLLAHDMHFAIESALMRGDGATALSVAEQFRLAYLTGTGSPRARVVGSAVWYAQGLHGDPQAVLRIAEPEQSNVLHRAMRHYARGEALARQGDAAAVRAEAAAIAAIVDGPEAPQLGGRAPAILAAIARHVLEGRAAMIAGDHAAAQAAYRLAMEQQAASNFGSDPPLWWYSVRRSVAAATLAAGDAASAREQLLASLADWPNDALALLALSRAEMALGNRVAAEDALARARANWTGDVSQVPLARI